MTIIAAATDGEVAAISSDDRGNYASVNYDVGTKLIHVFDQVAIGFSGTFPVEQWIRRELAHVMRNEQRRWSSEPMAFVEAIEDAWDGWRRWNLDRGNWDSAEDCECLLAAPGLILRLEGNGAVVRPQQPYDAIGSGHAVAQGAFAALPDVPPAVAVEIAVEAAILHASGCGGGAHVLEMRR